MATPQTNTHSPFSAAFEQAERELGKSIGFPALVYDAEQSPRYVPEPYTPGPWMEFAESGDYWIAQVVEDGMPGETICDSNGISEGNVNLICSAPTLAAENAALRTKNETIWSACVAQEDEIAALRLALDEAYQHVEALVSVMGRTSKTVPFCDCDHCQTPYAAVAAARAWLRREAK